MTQGASSIYLSLGHPARHWPEIIPSIEVLLPKEGLVESAFVLMVRRAWAQRLREDDHRTRSGGEP